MLGEKDANIQQQHSLPMEGYTETGMQADMQMLRGKEERGLFRHLDDKEEISISHSFPNIYMYTPYSLTAFQITQLFVSQVITPMFSSIGNNMYNNCLCKAAVSKLKNAAH